MIQGEWRWATTRKNSTMKKDMDSTYASTVSGMSGKLPDIGLHFQRSIVSVHEITVGHRTFSAHLRHLSVQKSECSAILSEQQNTHDESVRARLN